MPAENRNNWKKYNKYVNILANNLQNLDQSQSPLNSLRIYQDCVLALKESSKRENLHIVGRVNLSQLLIKTNNTLEGIRHGLNSGDLSRQTMSKILTKLQEDFMPIQAELAEKLKKQKINDIIESVGEQTTAAGRELSNETYNNFADAMQTVVERMKNDGNGSSVDKSASRDLLHMSNIITKNKNDLNRMKAEINKIDWKNEQFHLLGGPVLIGAALDPNKLKAANVDYDVVYFPGIRFGTGFAHKEASPRFYILRNQSLLTIRTNNPDKFTMKLKGKSLTEKTRNDYDKFKNITGDVLSLLEHRLGESYVHVGQERGKYITNREFPGVAFMLLMKKSIYNRIGPFSSSNTLELPF